MPTFQVFQEFKKRQHNGNGGDLDAAAAVKVALVNDTLAPVAATHTEWTDFSANEVSGTGYTSGGAAVANPSLTESGGDMLYSHDDVVWSQDAGGFTDARYAIWYFAATGDLIGYLDFGEDKGNVDGPLTIDVTAAGVCLI